MNINFMLFAKLFLIFYIWALISIFIFFILKSKKIYNLLKHYEFIFKSKRKEVVHNFIPLAQIISKYNKNLQTLFSGVGLFQGLRVTFNFLRKSLR